MTLQRRNIHFYSPYFFNRKLLVRSEQLSNWSGMLTWFGETFWHFHDTHVANQVIITDRVCSTRESYVLTHVCPSICLSKGGGGTPARSRPPPPRPVRTTEGILATRRSICLLRSRRRTFFVFQWLHVPACERWTSRRHISILSCPDQSLKCQIVPKIIRPFFVAQPATTLPSYLACVPFITSFQMFHLRTFCFEQKVWRLWVRFHLSWLFTWSFGNWTSSF